MNLKFNIFLIILSVLAENQVKAGTIQKPTSQNIRWGAHKHNDVLLSKEIVIKKFKLMGIKSGDYVYRPTSGDLRYFRKITQIDVTDQYTNGNGGYATIKDGGPGTNYVVIHFKSKRNHGYNFIIDIYGQC